MTSAEQRTSGGIPNIGPRGRVQRRRFGAWALGALIVYDAAALALGWSGRPLALAGAAGIAYLAAIGFLQAREKT